MHPSDFAKARTTEEKAAAAYSAAESRHVGLLSVFQRSLRISEDLLERLERDMHAGFARAEYNPAHTRDLVALSRALAQTGAVHARLLENESARAQALSEEEKVAVMLAHLKDKPLSQRQDFAAKLLAGV